MRHVYVTAFALLSVLMIVSCSKPQPVIPTPTTEFDPLTLVPKEIEIVESDMMNRCQTGDIYRHIVGVWRGPEDNEVIHAAAGKLWKALCADAKRACPTARNYVIGIGLYSRQERDAYGSPFVVGSIGGSADLVDWPPPKATLGQRDWKNKPSDDLVASMKTIKELRQSVGDRMQRLGKSDLEQVEAQEETEARWLEDHGYTEEQWDKAMAAWFAWQRGEPFVSPFPAR
jgi:hypothetical protein